MDAMTMDTTNTADREIIISREFDAPRELVFSAWTDAKHLAHWWGPRGFTITTYEMDFRPGGTWRFMMHGPDGTDFPNKIIYIEIVKPERLVFNHGGANDEDPGKFHVTTTFVEQGGKTRVTMRSLFATAAERDFVVKNFRAIEGGTQTLERLGEYLMQR